MDPGLPVNPWSDQHPGRAAVGRPGLRAGDEVVGQVSHRAPPVAGSVRIAGTDGPRPRCAPDRRSGRCSICRAMTDDRRLTAQGQERKQQLLDLRRRAVRRAGLRRHAGLDIVQAAPAWPRASSTGTSRTRKRCSASWSRSTASASARPRPTAIDPDAEPLLRIRQGAEASVRLHGAATPASSRCSRSRTSSKQFADELRQGTEVHTADVAALIRRGHRRRHHPRRGPGAARPTAWSAPSATTATSTAPGRIACRDELAAFVGRFVVVRPGGRRGDRPPRPRRAAAGAGLSPVDTGPPTPDHQPAAPHRTRRTTVAKFLSDEWHGRRRRPSARSSGADGGGAAAQGQDEPGHHRLPRRVGDGAVDAHMDTTTARSSSTSATSTSPS